LRTDLAYPKLNVKIVGFIPGILSEANGPTHQAIQDIALINTMPEMDIFIPSDYYDLVNSMPHIMKSNKPAYVRANHLKSEISKSKDKFLSVENIIAGDDCAIFSYGILIDQSILVAKELLKRGIECSVYNFRSINPIDLTIFKELTKKRKPIIIIEDHQEFGGLYSTLILKSEFSFDKEIIKRINLNNSYHDCLSIKSILESGIFSVENLSRTIVDFIHG